MQSSTYNVGELPPGFDAVSRMRYLYAGRASKVTPSGRLQSCIIIVLVDALLVCSHRGGVHRYLPIEAIRSLTTFPRGWLLLNCSGPVPSEELLGAAAAAGGEQQHKKLLEQASAPSKVHDLMLVLSVPQRLIDVLNRVRAARLGMHYVVSPSDQIPSLADFRLRPLESAPTPCPMRMWALAAAAATQSALDTLSAHLENRDTPGANLLARPKVGRQPIAQAQKEHRDTVLVPVRARGPAFPYAAAEWLTGALGEHQPANLIVAVARFVPSLKQAAAVTEGAPINGTAQVVFPLHFEIAAIISFAHARMPHVAAQRGGPYDVPAVAIKFIAPKKSIDRLRYLATPPQNAYFFDHQQQQGPHYQPSEPFKALRVCESFLFSLMKSYADRVMHHVSVERQIVSASGMVTQMPPAHTEGVHFWRNPRIALFG
jgi:hypothetical protein